ncbi:hypothetical protein [Roseovarius sp. Pro17]|uniref:hypothetical protein n=1 Tax=Roseovarius sp. Pro17 TaxID=3108175 RepID=UPI002D791F4A|nr:hypothetical protein [Roseovarius sp. Pro17]
MNRKNKCVVEVRWHPGNIGAVEARLGDEWFEIPAVQDGLEGVSAQAWLAASRELRASDPARKAHDQEVIFKAIEAITSRNAAAIATAGLIVTDWSPERILREENRNLIGFAVGSSKMDAKRDGAAGRVIPDADEYDPSVEVPKKKPVPRLQTH